ncbi:MAG: M1 family metallopeptidase [Thermoplasmata archaeon]|nr:M1 family metallopeptidase [Thermoplasmata archaeon]
MRIERYRIDLDLDESGLSFRGRVAIDLDGDESELRPHAKDLTIHSILVDGNSLPHTYDPAEEQLVIPGAGTGRRTLTIEYSGRILDKGLTGLYRSPFGPGRTLISSMMYPTGARRVLPCWDIPSAKGVFEWTVTVDASSRVIFNTEPAKEEVVGNRRRIAFAPTPRMSTYLLYLGVGPFSPLTGQAGPVTIRVQLPPGRESAGQFALEHACRVLPAFESFYGIPYPLPKLDLVAVPDFWAGAMENWGAIAFRETLLVVEQSTSARLRRAIRETISHEIAHQWFGNLVTNAWWNDFWLNEAFATFAEATIDAALYPDLDTWSDFVLRFTRWGLEGDALTSTHPVDVAVRRPSELAQIADEVTYGKGATILRMLEGYLGETVFRDGVNRYLKRHAYGSATGNDLWNSLEESAGGPVTRVMRAWIDRPGYPVLDARVEGDVLQWSQRRFTYLGSDPSEAPWPIPFAWQRGATAGRALVEGREGEIRLGPGVGPLLANPKRSGFYRIAYDPTTFSQLVEEAAQLDDVDRWGLISDTGAFVRAGIRPVRSYVDLIGRLGPFAGYLTSSEVRAGLTDFEPFLDRGDGSLRRAFLAFFREQVQRFGIEPQGGETEIGSSQRGRSLLGLTRIDQQFAETLAPRFQGIDRADAELRPAIALAYAIARGGGAYETLLGKMERARGEDEATQMATALAAIPDPATVDACLALVGRGEMPLNRSVTLLGELSRNQMAGGATWAWCTQHLDSMAKRTTGTPLLSKFLEAAIPTLGLGRSREVSGYFADHPFPEADRGVGKGLELLRIGERISRAVDDR